MRYTRVRELAALLAYVARGKVFWKADGKVVFP